MSSVGAGVDYELGHGEVLIPVVLLSAHIEAEVFLYFLVSAFCLSIGLRVTGGREAGLDPQSLE